MWNNYADTKVSEEGRRWEALHARTEIPLKPIEDCGGVGVYPEACEGLHSRASRWVSPEGNCSLWKAQAEASTWQRLESMERSPCRSRFSGRNCGCWWTHSGVVFSWRTILPSWRTAAHGKRSLWRTVFCGGTQRGTSRKVWGGRGGRDEVLWMDCNFYSLPLCTAYNWTNYMAGALQFMATNCSEGTGKEGEVSLYVKKWIDCTELSFKNSNEWLESLCVGMKLTGNLVVSVYYRLLGKREGVDKVFLL